MLSATWSAEDSVLLDRRASGQCVTRPCSLGVGRDPALSPFLPNKDF